MNRFRKALIGLGFCASGIIISSHARADNWPQFRGPQRTGIVTEKGLAETWPEQGPKELWRKTIGIGFASPVAVDGRVYAFYLGGDKRETLEAFDAKSGNSLWKQSTATASRYTGGYPGTRCTPVIDGDRIYTYDADGTLTGRNLADGKGIWTVDVMQETGSRQTGRPDAWGNSSSPLVDGDAIYVQSREEGNVAVRVNKADGKVVWKSDAKGGGYASPAMAEVGGVKMLLCFAKKNLIAIDANTGKALWELGEPYETQYEINSSLPIVRDGKVFLTCAYNNAHCGLYELSPTGAKKLWGGKQITARFQAPILDDGYLYANSEGMLTCVRWADGKVMWPTKPTNADRNFLSMGGSIIRFGGDKMICLNSGNGALSLVRATPQEMEKIRTVKRFSQGDQIWATPLVYDGRLYIKEKDDLVAYDISAAK